MDVCISYAAYLYFSILANPCVLRMTLYLPVGESAEESVHICE